MNTNCFAAVKSLNRRIVEPSGRTDHGYHECSTGERTACPPCAGGSRADFGDLAERISDFSHEKTLRLERVVLNALAKKCGFTAGYLRAPRIIGHRLQEKPIHLGEQKSVHRFTKGEVKDAHTARV